MNLLFSPEFQPFIIAAFVMLGLIGAELLALLIGVSLSDFVEKSIDVEGAGGLMGWLNVGRAPFLIYLMLAMMAFSVAGFIIQMITTRFGAPLPMWIAATGAVAAALPVARAGSRMVSAIIPRDETYVVELADFVGSIGTVAVGPVDQGLPGQVRVKDRFGNWHMLRTRAAPDGPDMAKGKQALLVDFKDGVFVAVPAPEELRS